MTPLERLFALEQFGIKLGLDNIREILAALGHPERTYRTIHIGGTNGKGSVAAMVERGLRAAGLKTGRYTSPHLDRIEERVAIGGQVVDRQTFEGVTSDVLGVVESLSRRSHIDGGPSGEGGLSVPPTFFEVSTAVAFEIFRRAAVDVAVVEVGLGGRFDATNVLTPTITAITTIAFDHERHLGSTLEQIAFEKAGIAKPGVPLVIGRLPREAASQISSVTREVGAPIVDAHARPANDRYASLNLALAGRHQLENAAVAVSILEQWSLLVSPISNEAIVTGLTDCEWPARLEWLRVPFDSPAGGVATAQDCPVTLSHPSGREARAPRVEEPYGELLIDAAHNPAGAAALASYLQDTGAEKMPIVLAVMADKDATSMIAALAPAASAFIATTVPHARARSADQLSAEIRQQFRSLPVESIASPDEAVARALERSRRAVACGSIYMVGPLRARLLARGATRL